MSSSSTRLPTAEGHGSVQSAQLHLDHHNRIKETHMSVTIEKSSVTTAVRPFTVPLTTEAELEALRARHRGGNRSVIPDTTLREAEMTTAQQHTNIPSTAVVVAPGLWRTNLQRYDLSVPGREMIQSRVDIEPDSPPVRHFHPGEEVIYVLEGSGTDYRSAGWRPSSSSATGGTAGRAEQARGIAGGDEWQAPANRPSSHAQTEAAGGNG
jgi:hypothetical protein